MNPREHTLLRSLLFPTLQILPVCGDLITISKQASTGAYTFSLHSPSDGSCPEELSPDSDCFAIIADMLALGLASDGCLDGDFAADLALAMLDLATRKCELSVYGLPAYIQMKLVRKLSARAPHG